MTTPSVTPTWRVVIADDEPLARTRLRGLLQRHPAFGVSAECASGTEVLHVLGSETADVLFLDIRMPGLDGLQVADALLRDGAPVPLIVFVTAYDSHAVQAFEVDAIDYLVKPVDIDRFDRTMGRLTEALERGATRATDSRHDTMQAALEALTRLQLEQAYPTRFPVRSTRGIYFVQSREIERVEAEGNYVALVAGGKRHLVRETMQGIEQRLDPKDFIRVHRSTILRVDCIKHLEPWGHGEYQITLSDGTRVTSSRTCSDAIQRLIR